MPMHRHQSYPDLLPPQQTNDPEYGVQPRWRNRPDRRSFHGAPDMWAANEPLAHWPPFSDTSSFSSGKTPVAIAWHSPL